MTRVKKFASEDLSLLIQAVADNLIDAGIHYKLFRNLVDAIPEHHRLMNEARAFWTLTLVGHRDAAVFRLCRVYDQEKGAIGLGNLLRAIHTNRELFSNEHFKKRLSWNPHVESLAKSYRTPLASQIKADIASTTPDDPLVKRLTVLRNNIFAHTSLAHALDRSKFDKAFALQSEEIWALVERGLAIVNRYSDLFQASTYAKDIVGYDDYKKVFAALKADYSKRIQDLKREFREAGMLDLEFFDDAI